MLGLFRTSLPTAPLLAWPVVVGPSLLRFTSRPFTTTESKATVPFMITSAMQGTLETMGYSKEDIRGMTPEYAHHLIEHDLVPDKNVELLLARARLHNIRKEYKEAIELTSKILALEPTRSDTLQERSRAYCGRGDYEEALEDVTTALKINPYNISAYCDRAAIYHIHQKYESAFTDYTRAIGMDPYRASTYTARGATLMGLRDLQASIQDSTLAIAILTSELTEAYASRGNAYYRKGEYEQAIEDYTHGLSTNDKMPSLWGNRGCAAAALERHADAVRDFSTYLEFCPNDPHPMLMRGWSLVHLGTEAHLLQAHADVEATLRLDPQSNDAAALLQKLTEMDQAAGREYVAPDAATGQDATYRTERG